MRVIHVALTPFGQGGIYGGGERYPLALARALTSEVECELPILYAEFLHPNKP